MIIDYLGLLPFDYAQGRLASLLAMTGGWGAYNDVAISREKTTLITAVSIFGLQ